MPIIYMLGSVLLFGSYPLFASISADQISPGVLVAFSHLLAAILMGIFVLCSSNLRELKWVFVNSTREEKFSITWKFLSDGISNAASKIFLITSFAYIGEYAASIIYDAWPILSMVVIPYFIAKKYQLGIKDYLFSVISFVGLVIIITGQSGSLQAITPTDEIGIVLALGAMIAMGLSAVVNLMAEREIVGMKRFEYASKNWISTDVFSAIFANMVSKTVTGIAALIFTFLFEEPRQVIPSTIDINVIFAFVAVVVIVTFGGILFILANIEAHSSGINLIWNLTPLVAIILLFVSGVGGTLDKSVAVGSILIIAANLAVSLELALIRSYYIFLFSFCVLVGINYFTVGLNDSRYFLAMSLPAGIFSIITGFLIARSHNNKAQQSEIAVAVMAEADKLTISIRRNIRMFVEKVMLAPSHQGVSTEALKLSRNISVTNPELSQQVLQLGMLRVRSANYAEASVVWLLALVITSLAILFRGISPVDQLVSVFVPAAIIFIASYATEYPTNIFERYLFLAEEEKAVKDLESAERDYQVKVFIAIIFTTLMLLVFIWGVLLDK